MIADAPAKINLMLRVLAREAGGYHQIESLFCALELCDEIMVERTTRGVEVGASSDDPSLANVVIELNADPRSNLVHRAAVAFFKHTGLDGGARISVTKRIPAGAGMGGGSSDAAATLAALNETYARPLDRGALLSIAAAIGSDVPFFLCGSPLALAWGRGTRMLPLPPIESRPVVLAAPSEAVSTADAYAALANVRAQDYAAPPAVLPFAAESPTRLQWSDVARFAANDFENVVFTRIPELAEIRSDLRKHGAGISRMTGTGSVVFGIFADDDAADRAATALRNDFRNIRTIVTRTAAHDVSLFAPVRPLS